MSDGRQRSLQAVRMVRERVEEREERALGEMSRQVQQGRVVVEGLRAELAALYEMEVRRFGALSSGAEIQQRAAELEGLKRREADTVKTMERLEVARAEQMQRYRAAHAECEAIRELQEQRHVAWMAALDMRESKSRDEMFLGRRSLLQQRLEEERVTG